MLVLGATFFVSAGTIHYWQAWMYLAVIFVPMMLGLGYLMRNDIELLVALPRCGDSRVTVVAYRVWLEPGGGYCAVPCPALTEERKMTRKKLGLTLFWIGAIYAFVFAIPVGAYLDTTIRVLTLAELNQTMWAPNGLWLNFWGFSPPAGALVAGIGLLLYAGAGGARVWAYGVGITVVVFLGMALAFVGHFPPLFGIGGTLIVLSFLGILWFWAQERLTLEGKSTQAADLRLVGYVFFFIAAWFTCGIAGFPFMKPFAAGTPTSPIYIMVCFAMGWLFLFLSHYRARKAHGSPAVT